MRFELYSFRFKESAKGEIKRKQGVIMIKVAICDDIRAERQNIQTELERYLSVRGLTDQFEFEVFSDPIAMIRRCSVVDFNLFLLDILMPQITGIETAKELQEILPEAQFIFITTTSEFVMDAISLKALYYLLKPYSSADFDEAMDRAKNFFLGEEKQSVLLSDSNHEQQRIVISDVIYAQGIEKGKDKDIKLVMKNQVLPLDGITLEDLKGRFDEGSMIRVGNFLYNVENIRHISDKAVTMRNGEKLTVSKEDIRGIREAFIEYYER